ncbi:hypothetical protein GCM10022227_49500 [Streptomyces sedi]
MVGPVDVPTAAGHVHGRVLREGREVSQLLGGFGLAVVQVLLERVPRLGGRRPGLSAELDPLTPDMRPPQ